MKLFIQRNLGVLVSAFVFLATLVTVTVAVSIMGFETTTDATSVRSIYLGNVESANFESVLNTQMTAYTRDATLVFTYQGKILQRDLSFLTPDVGATLSNLNIGVNNQAVFRLSAAAETALLNELQSNFSPDIVAALDFNALNEAILSSANNMKRFNTIELTQFMREDALRRLNTVTLNNIPPIDGLTISSSLQRFDVPRGERFSLLAHTASLGLRNDQLSVLASGIQGLMIPTSAASFRSTMDPVKPSWYQPGMNVRILQLLEQDFSFVNVYDSDLEIRILASNNNTTLTFELWGFPTLNQYSTSNQQTLTIPFSTTVINDATLTVTTAGITVTETDTQIILELVEVAGVNGSVIDIFRTITPRGQSPFTRRVLREVYSSQPATVRRLVIDKEVD